MMTATETQAHMDDPVQRRLDEHVDAVERVLQLDGMTRSERRAITDELETQIHEMLAERPTQPPSLKDLEAILAKLDPPGAYRRGGNVPGLAWLDRAYDAAWPPHAMWGLGLCALGWAALVLGLLLSGDPNAGGAILLNLVGLYFAFRYRKTYRGRQGLLACSVSLVLLILAF